MNKKDKLGRKGFMLLETLIVSTVILSSLVFMYVQFVNIKTNYDRSFRYNTVPDIYMAKTISDYLTDNGDIDILKSTIDNAENGYIDITNANSLTNSNSDIYSKLIMDMGISTILYVKNDFLSIKNYLDTPSYDNVKFSESFKKYILNMNADDTGKDKIIIKFNNNTFVNILVGGDLNE